MRSEIPHEIELIGAKSVALFHYLPGNTLHFGQVASRNLSECRIGQLIHDYYFRSQSLHHPCSLHRVSPAHYRHEVMSFDRAYYGKAGTHISTGKLYDSLSRFQVS